MFEIFFAATAKQTLDALAQNPAKASLVKQLKKSIGFLQTDPRHPSLSTHAYDSIPHPYRSGEKVFEAYAQNKTPSAYRIFWCYGPKSKQITVIAITPHP